MPYKDPEAAKANKKAYYLKNKEALDIKIKINYEANKETVLARNKLRYEANKDEILAKQRVYGQLNKEAIAARGKVFREKNKEILRAKKKIYRDANLDKTKAWREANKEDILAKRIANKSIIADKAVIYRQVKKEQIKVYGSEYRRANKGRRNALLQKYRTAKMNRTPIWTTENDIWMMREIYELSELRSRLTRSQWNVDHIIPLQGKLVSGLHVPSNLQVIPATQNIKKYNNYVS